MTLERADLLTRSAKSLMLSSLTTMALFTKIQVLPIDSDQPIYKIINSDILFQFLNNASIPFYLLIIIAITLVYWKINTLTRNIVKMYVRVLLLFFAVMFGLLQVIGLSMNASDSLDFMLCNKLQHYIAFLCVSGYTILFYYIGLCSFYIFNHINNNHILQHIKLGHFPYSCIFSFTFILLAWLPWLIIFYPGSTQNDGIRSVLQILGYYKLTDHHPIFITWIMGNIFKIGRSFAGDNNGIFLFILFQSVISALIYAHISMVVLKLTKSRVLFWITISYYSFVTYFGGWAQTLVKDTLFSSLFALFVLETTQILLHKRNTTEITCFFALALIVCFTRHNAKYAVFPILFLLPFLKYDQAIRKKIIIGCIAVIAAYCFSRFFIYDIMHIKRGSTTEALSIPLQQLARYARDYGADISKKEKNIINTFLNYNKLSTLYNPNASLPVKNTVKTNLIKRNPSLLKDCLKVWYDLFKRHPRNHLEAFFAISYGYYAFTSEIKARPQIYTNLNYPRFERFKIRVRYFFPASTRSILKNYHHIISRLPIISLVHQLPFYIWSIIIIFIYFIYKKYWLQQVILIPFIMLFLTCIASPVNGSVRYFLPIIAAFPNLLIALFANNERVIS